MPVLTHLTPLDAATLKRIMTEPKNALVRQYKKLFAMEGIDLAFTDDALDYIVSKAFEFKLGARGLRSICETIMLDAMFDLPGQKVTKVQVDKHFAIKHFENMSTQSPEQKAA